MVTDLVRKMEGARGGRSLSLLMLGGSIVVLILALTYWATRPDWVLLAHGSDPGEVGQIVETLDDEGIPFRLESRGTGVSVPASEMARARVVMARGGVSIAGRPGFELFDQPTWGMTDFTQRINYRRALEGELERTISRMRGIEAAQVHLGLHESAVVRRTGNPAEASVVVALNRSRPPDPSLASGIASLVAGSVDGLEAKDVRILDDTGRLLTEDPAGVDSEGFVDRQLRVRREVERHLETKAEDLLRAVVGEGNLSVRVSANLDFDQIERTVSSVDPEAQVILQEDRSEIVPGNEEQGAAQSITSTTYEPARSVESFNRSGARLDRLTVAVIVGHRLETGEDGEPVPVPRDPDEMAGIQELVGSAVGLVPDRGDVITVTNLPFIRTDPPAPPPAPPVGMLERIEEFQRPIVALLGILMALGMGLALLRTVSRTEASQQTLPGNEARAIAKGSPSDHPERDEDKTSTLPGGGEGAGQRGFREEASESPAPLARLAQIENPDLTARVVRTWMKEA